MVHYPTDVIAGAIEGILIAVCIWFVAKFFEWLLNRNKSKHANKRSFDMAVICEKKLGRKIDYSKASLILVLVILCFGAATYTKINLDKAKNIRCEHQGPDYICMNEGKSQITDENGNIHYYCELHD